ncbi:MAG: 3-phosphoshikimate 1-carboxyvinyltransferase [Rickettsiales bacterium]|nr:3-phosphoshikimate 1-carboxyvinyltransferase [Rickettsiales bacterium]
MPNNFTSNKSSKLAGNIIVPGDKSISHRALIFASQAIGRTKISGLLESEDVLNTKACLQKLGVKIEKENNQYIVDGVGVGGLSEPTDFLDCGNSGTGCRLLMGLVAPYNFRTFFTGDESLRGRPMRRVTAPLQLMGANFEAREENFLPLMVKGGEQMLPIEYELPVASAQVKSAILLCALNTPGITTIIEKEKTRDHTEMMIKHFGGEISITQENGLNIIKYLGQQNFVPKDVIVPADPSSAAFPLVAAIITEGSEVTIKNVLINPTRIGLYITLQEMGANLEFTNKRIEAGEEVADIIARYSPNLQAVEVPAERAPSMIDEYPILSIVAAKAKGKTIMKGLTELKVKESNRLEAIRKGLELCGVEAVISADDTLSLEGGEIKGGALIPTHGDHRIAMSFLVAGLISSEPISVDKPEMISTSFPKFKELMISLGAKILAKID